MPRKTLERVAHAAGISFTHDVDDVTLERLVMEKAAEVEVVDPRGWNDKQILKEYECYGSMFADDEPVCMERCLVRDRCIARFVGRLPGLAVEAGKPIEELDDTVIMENTGATASGVALARKLIPMMNLKTGRWAVEGNPILKFLPPQAEVTTEPESEPESEPEPTAPETVHGGVVMEAIVVDEPAKPKKAPPKKAAAPIEPAKPKKAPPKKAVVPPAPPAPTKKATTKKTTTKKTTTKKTTKDGESDVQRFERERARSSAVGKLKTGTLLQRDYDGKTHSVKVLKDGYEYEGTKYPTLYSVVLVITGPKQYPRQAGDDGKVKKGTRTMSNWSAPKFFKLKK